MQFVCLTKPRNHPSSLKNLNSGPTQVNQKTICSAQLAFENDQNTKNIICSPLLSRHLIYEYPKNVDANLGCSIAKIKDPIRSSPTILGLQLESF